MATQAATRPDGLIGLLGLLARIVLRIDVFEIPRPVCTDLDNRVFVDEDMVRHTWGEGDEAPREQGLGLALISSFSHALGAPQIDTTCKESRRRRQEAPEILGSIRKTVGHD